MKVESVKNRLQMILQDGLPEGLPAALTYSLTDPRIEQWAVENAPVLLEDPIEGLDLPSYLCGLDKASEVVRTFSEVEGGEALLLAAWTLFRVTQEATKLLTNSSVEQGVGNGPANGASEEAVTEVSE